MNITQREIAVLRLVSEGYTNREIAERMCLSFHTIKRHIDNAMVKLSACNRTHAVVTAIKSGLL